MRWKLLIHRTRLHCELLLICWKCRTSCHIANSLSRDCSCFTDKSLSIDDVSHDIVAAAKICREGLDSFPSDSYLHFILGVSLLDAHQYDDGRSHLTQALAEIDSRDQTVAGDFEYRAYVLSALGRFQEAVESSTRSSQMDSTNPGPLYTRARAYDGLGLHTAAEADRATADKLASKR